MKIRFNVIGNPSEITLIPEWDYPPMKDDVIELSGVNYVVKSRTFVEEITNDGKEFFLTLGVRPEKS